MSDIDASGKSFGSIEFAFNAQKSYVEKTEEVGDELPSGLDQYSTSATYSADLCFPCINHAPLFAYAEHEKTYGIVQGCCNSWNCPRCGKMRAKQEYWRIVNGIKLLAESKPIWFITVTCKGREISTQQAEENYLSWTKRLHDAWRLQAKRTGQEWTYCAVTERQKRGHPHSHYLTTFCPTDIAVDWKLQRVTVAGESFMAYVSAYRSEYLYTSLVRSGLGKEYDITQAQSIEGTGRYVAKYLFKDTIFSTTWPKGWHRVRYSQSFPPAKREKTDAFVLLTKDDWKKLARVAIVVKTRDAYVSEEAKIALKGSDVILLNRAIRKIGLN